MKPLNNIKFVSTATKTFGEWLDAIDKTETYEAAKEKAYGAMGYLDCMVDYMNCMIDLENNDFTMELDGLLLGWELQIYNRMIAKAHETKQNNSVIFKLMRRADEIRNG